METKLLHKKKMVPLSTITCLSKTIDFRVLNKFWIVFFGLFLSNYTINAQENNGISPLTIIEHVVPNVNATTNGGNSFLGPLTNSARTYQLLIAESQLTNLTGKHLISISFRSTSSTSSDWPTSSTTYNNYDIFLSGSVNPANRSFVFAQNVVGTQTQVRSGSLVIPVGVLSFGSSPNNFSFDIAFTTPWYYTGGNLLVEIRHDGNSGSSKSVDAAGTSSSGYGSLYSACWGNSYTSTSTTTQGNFAVVNFKADDALKVEAFEKNELTVFPNPTSETLFIESEVEVSNVKLFNMLGQMVFNQDMNEQKGAISLSKLSVGTYLLHVESEFGTEIRKVVKK